VVSRGPAFLYVSGLTGGLVAKKRDKAATGEIQTLLDERKRIEQWLVRLAKAADRTPAAVRDKVRGDYEARLSAVVTQLQGYEEDLRGSLEEVQARYAAAREEESQATEELSEAELRYAVGEFGDAAWSEKKTTILDRLIRIREELALAEEEIAELQEVLASIAAAPAEAAAEAPEPAAAAAEPEIAELDVEEPPAKTAPAPSRVSLGADLGLRDLTASGKRPAVSAGGARAPKKEIAGDELEFLKALSDDGQSRDAGTKKAAKAAKEAPAHEAPAPKARSVEALSEANPLSRSRPSVINQRTLKCGECGAMNLPTEWYCDRCGAELASL
jgi:hypothetical protein